MRNIRCRCGKIVCQVANMPDLPQVEERLGSLNGPVAVILCRHCKRYVVLQFPVLTGRQGQTATTSESPVSFLPHSL